MKQRAILQSKRSKAANRRLARISGRENRWMDDVNSKTIKALIKRYGPNTEYGIESLKGVRFATENVSHKHRYVQVSWPFYDLGVKWIRKTNLNRSRVTHVDAHYTSQYNPFTKQVEKSDRDHKHHTYICWTGKYDHQGHKIMYKTNDDRLGGMNIYMLTNLKVHGAKDPRILKNGKIVKNYKRYRKRLKAKAGKQTRR